MKNDRWLRIAALAAALGLPLGACDDGAGPNAGTRLRLELTDAPADYIDAAEVDIGAIELVPADGGSAPVELTTDGTDGYVDLLDLQGTATAALAEADVEPGTYAQLRLVVETANVTLADGHTFPDGSATRALKVPSGAQTGIKLDLAGASPADDGADEGGLEVAPGETVLVIDFDVNQSFVLNGNPETPAGIKRVLFTPVLRVTVRDVAGSISGTVATDEGVAVEGLTVTAEPTGDGVLEAYQTETATAATEADGGYSIEFVVPGDYELSLELPDTDEYDGLAADPATRSVTVGRAEDVTGADFSIVAGG